MECNITETQGSKEPKNEKPKSVLQSSMGLINNMSLEGLKALNESNLRSRLSPSGARAYDSLHGIKGA